MGNLQASHVDGQRKETAKRPQAATQRRRKDLRNGLGFNVGTRQGGPGKERGLRTEQAYKGRFRKAMRKRVGREGLCGSPGLLLVNQSKKPKGEGRNACPEQVKRKGEK